MIVDENPTAGSDHNIRTTRLFARGGYKDDSIFLRRIVSP
jgi:hypothetical protein